MDKCLKKRPNQLKLMRATHNHQLDQDGVDFLIYFKFKDADGTLQFFPLALPVQVKTSDDANTVGVILPLPDALPPKLKNRITLRKLGRIRRHQGKHGHISCILFVGRPADGKTEAAILEDIWRELKKMKDFIKRYRFPHFK